MEAKDDYIRYYDQGLPEDLCDQAITFLEKQIHDENCVRHNQSHLRNHEITIPNPKNSESVELTKKINHHLINLIKKYMDEVVKATGSDTVFSCRAIEGLKMVRYDPNPNEPEQFAYHSDSWNNVSSSRQISIILYLNDVKEGGDTNFRHQDASVDPKKGRVLFFPANWCYTHQGKPPVSNSKYIVVTWLHFNGATGYTTFPF
jgi:hypothetical protein